MNIPASRACSYLRDGEVLPREEFESRHAAVAAHRHALANPRPKTLLSAGRSTAAAGSRRHGWAGMTNQLQCAALPKFFKQHLKCR